MLKLTQIRAKEKWWINCEKSIYLKGKNARRGDKDKMESTVIAFFHHNGVKWLHMSQSRIRIKSRKLTPNGTSQNLAHVSLEEIQYEYGQLKCIDYFINNIVKYSNERRLTDKISRGWNSRLPAAILMVFKFMAPDDALLKGLIILVSRGCIRDRYDKNARLSDEQNW